MGRAPLVSWHMSVPHRFAAAVLAGSLIFGIAACGGSHSDGATTDDASTTVADDAGTDTGTVFTFAAGPDAGTYTVSELITGITMTVTVMG